MSTSSPAQAEPSVPADADATPSSQEPKTSAVAPRAIAVLVAGLSLGVAFNALVLQRGALPVEMARIEPAKTTNSARKNPSPDPKPIAIVADKKADKLALPLSKTEPETATQRRLELTAAHLEDLDPAAPDLIKAIQRELLARGFDPGSADGQNGSLTRAAILSFEFEEGLALTGEASQALLRRLVLGATSEDAKAKATSKPDAQGMKLVKAIQQALATLQYSPGPSDGILKAETVRAIREFEMDQGLSPSGRISGRLIGRLARVAGRSFELPSH